MPNTKNTSYTNSSAVKADDALNVVIRFIDVFGQWCICHAESYQNAFRASVKGFKTRSEAVSFAEKSGCTVVFHDFDQLQAG